MAFNKIRKILKIIGQNARSILFWLFPELKKKYHANVYELVARDLGNRYMPFLNYGYDYDKEPKAFPQLDDRDKPFVFNIQLYHYLTAGVPLKDKKVLEIGCGRGGGCYYMKKYCGAEEVTGLDFTQQSVDYANDKFKMVNLSYIQGDAQHLQFDDNLFDVVVNCESSHCYPDINAFLHEAIRVLKPSGHFCYADIGSVKRMADLENRLDILPAEILRNIDITKNVVRSLNKDNERKRAFIEGLGLDANRANWWRREFGCVQSPIWHGFIYKTWVYRCYTLQKK